eukprot:293218-Rhodomonas_salina.1
MCIRDREQGVVFVAPGFTVDGLGDHSELDEQLFAKGVQFHFQWVHGGKSGTGLPSRVVGYK